MPISVLFPALAVGNMSVTHSAAWFICLSVCSIFSLCDFGISSLVVKKLSSTPHLINHANFKKLSILYVTAVLLFIVVIPFNYRDNILSWYSLSSDLEVAFAFSCLLGYSALIAIQRVFDSCIKAHKLGYVTSNLEATVAILRLASIITIISASYEITLVSLVIAYTIPSVFSFLITLYYFVQIKNQTKLISSSQILFEIRDAGYSLKAWIITLSAYGNRSGFFMIAAMFLTNEDQVILGVVMLILTTAMQIISTSLTVIPPYVPDILTEFKTHVRPKFMRFLFYNQLLVTITLTGFLLLGLEILELVLNQPRAISYQIFLISSPILISFGFFSASNVARTVLMYSDESSYVCITEALFVIGYLSMLAFLLTMVSGDFLVISAVTSCYYIIRYHFGAWRKFKIKYSFSVRGGFTKFGIFSLLAAITYIGGNDIWNNMLIKCFVVIVGASYAWRELKRLTTSS